MTANILLGHLQGQGCVNPQLYGATGAHSC